ncbi:CHAT domain-containing protein [Leptolyngbya sp. PL-A3]|uniref:SAV_2336 N-terminal domain-related protein n=1 Tax=Leptolyngbya sp. PL-A3 TaxID=2933911 RepID=UPI0032978B4A
MIEELVAVLNSKLGLTGNEIADILWLALHIKLPESEQIDKGSSQVILDNLSRDLNQPATPTESKVAKETTSQSQNAEESPNLSTSDNQNAQQAGLFQDSQDNRSRGGRGKELAFKVPDAPSLREPLSLARALKPLMRRVPSNFRSILDEEATTQRIAKEKLWLPILKPDLEPWLDLALVVDESNSMVIWRHTIVELRRLMQNYGVFRDVRFWGLVVNDGDSLGEDKVQIRSGIGSSGINHRPRSPKELIDPSGRSLILFVSDCVSAYWYDGTLLPTLGIWAQSCPMAIVQMLPEWLWDRTALSRGAAVWFRSLTPGVTNQQLIVEGRSRSAKRRRRSQPEIIRPQEIKVPIITLEPGIFKEWAKMLSGKGGALSPGIIFEPSNDIFSESIGQDVFDELSAEERVQRFRATASPVARRLAILLAAAPVISLPVVRIIQDRLLSESRQVHVAEVFLGGLLKPLSEVCSDTNPDQVQYDFVYGVREVLLQSVPTSDAVNVFEEVSSYIAARLGLSVEAFAATLRAIEHIEDKELSNQTRPFATVTAQILKQLGGDYARFAEELEQKVGPIELSAEERVQRFRATASSVAKRLASLLAAAPQITLPVIHTIQGRFLPSSNETHVGEVLSGGLLATPQEAIENTASEEIQYDFISGVREILLATLPNEDAVAVLDVVSNYVSNQLNLSIDSFADLLRNPEQVEGEEIASQIRPFASISAEILKRLGGEYTRSQISRLAESFTGRERIFDVIENWLASATEQFLILVGEQGSGKSAITAQLIKRWEHQGIIAAYHFCRAGDVETVRPGRVLRSISAQLGETLPHYGKALNKVLEQVHLNIDINININSLTNSQVTGIYIENLKELDPIEELRLLIQSPIAALPAIYEEEGIEPPQLKVFLIDSLDQAVIYSSEKNLAMLLSSMTDLPSWIRFVFTTRPDNRVLSYLESKKSFIQRLDELSESNLNDIRSYISQRLSEPSLQIKVQISEKDPQLLLNELIQLSQGNFLYIKLLLDAIEHGQQSIQDISVAPKSLYELYHNYLKQLGSDWESDCKPVLGILAVAQTSITQEQIRNFSQLRNRTIQLILHEISQFLDARENETGENEYSLFHESLRVYLKDRETNQNFWCDPQEYHSKIVAYYKQGQRSWKQSTLEQIDDYGIHHLAHHLIEAGHENELSELLATASPNQLEFWIQTSLSFASQSEEVSAAILDAIVKNQDEQERVRVLTELTPHLPTRLLPSALETIQSIQSGSLRAQALMVLVEKLMPELLPRALEMSLSIQDAYARSQTLVALADKLPDALPRALEAVQAIESEDSRARALRALADKLPPELLPMALETSLAIEDTYSRVQALTAVAEKFPEAVPHALEAAQAIQNEGDRARALSAIASRLDASQPQLLQQALSVATAIQDESYRARALSAIAQQLDASEPQLLQQALHIAQELSDESYRAEVLNAIASQLNASQPELLQQALQAAQMIRDSRYRAETLIRLLPHLPESVHYQVFAATQETEYEPDRAKLLIQLAPLMSEEILTAALREIQYFQDIELRQQVLTGLSPHLPAGLQEQASQLFAAAEKTLLWTHQNTRVYAVHTDSPWNLPFDAFVMPVGYRGTFGALGDAFQNFLGQDSELISSAVFDEMIARRQDTITPDQPLLVSLPAAVNQKFCSQGDSTSQRFLICVTVESITGNDVNPEISTANAAVTSEAVIKLAVRYRFSRLVFPLIGTGRNRLSIDQTADSILGAISRTLETVESTTLGEIFIVDGDEAKVEALIRATQKLGDSQETPIGSEQTEAAFSPNLTRTEDIAQELLREVQLWEASHAATTQLGKGAEAVDSLLQSQLRFGNPLSSLIQLTEKVFQDVGIELTSIYKQQMQERFDFYYMTLPINLHSSRGVSFSQLTCELNLSSEEGAEPIVQTLFPSSRWKSVIELDTSYDVGLTGNLDWGIGVEPSILGESLKSVPNEIRTNIVSKEQFNLALTIPSYELKLKNPEIIVTGEGSATCRWCIKGQDLQEIGTIKFAIVFKVPKGARRSISLRGMVYAEPNINWLRSEIRDVFSQLPNRFKDLLRSRDTAANQLAKSAVEEWVFELSTSTNSSVPSSSNSSIVNKGLYIYRIQITNNETVKIQKQNEGQVLGELVGRFRYSDRKAEFTPLFELILYNELNSANQSKAIGEYLFDCLFDEPLSQDFVDFYNEVVRQKKQFLRIELDIDEQAMPEIAAIPWEFMRLPERLGVGTVWFATTPEIVFVRHRSIWMPPSPIQFSEGEKLRVALVVASPPDLPAISYDSIQKELNKIVKENSKKIEFLPVVNSATLNALDDTLSRKPHILHFIGHVRLTDEIQAEMGQVALVDDTFDESMWVDADYFSELFNRHCPALVLMHASESAKLSSSKTSVSIALRLVQQNVPTVIGFQDEVTNATANRFALRFYQSLVQGDAVDTAVQQGRRAIALGPTQYRKRDFATPVLYTRVRNSQVFFERSAE